MAVKFATEQVSYLEDRADGGFAWDVAYDLKADGEAVNVSLRVDLVGDNPGSVADIWEKGTEAIWNKKVFFSDGNKLHEVKLDLDFVNSNAHQTVNVTDGEGRANMTEWFTVPQGFGSSFADEMAAHEVGHMLGAFDEYVGGATFGGFTTTGTLMSDLTPEGLADYFFGIEFFAEQFSGETLATVEARVGTGSGNSMSGTNGLDGFYGLGGGDTITAKGGNDFLDGGNGNDTLRGDSGKDILKGQAGNDNLNGGAGSDDLRGAGGDDLFVFDAVLGTGNVDRIRGFVTTDDDIMLDNAIFDALAGTSLSGSAFHIGTSAADGGDRIIFNAATGALLYDEDGKGGVDAVQFASISGLVGTLQAADFAII